MALMHTPICDFGWKAVDFSLPGTDGRTYTLSDVKGPNGLLIMFICNHCPYVKAIADRLARDADELQKAGFGVVAIMPNDTKAYPEDDLAHMKVFAVEHGFSFPYLIDESQATARAYDAICTPDFFGFNRDLELQYRGRLDESGKQPAPPDAKRELLQAMMMIAETGHGPKQQTASMGCSIKWRD